MKDEIFWIDSIFTRNCNAISKADLVSAKKFNASRILQDLVLVGVTKRKGSKGPEDNLVASKAKIDFYFNDNERHPKAHLTVEVRMKYWESSTSIHGNIPKGVGLPFVLSTVEKVKKTVWGGKYLDIVHDPYENQIETAIQESQNENTQSRRPDSKRGGVPRIQKNLQSRVGKEKVLRGRNSQGKKIGAKTGQVRYTKPRTKEKTTG